MKVLVLVALLLAFSCGAISTRASAQALPPIPALVREAVAAKAGRLAFVPTRLPATYRYRGYRYDPELGLLTFRFVDVRYPRAVRRWLAFTVQRYRGVPADCGEERFRIAGSVYADGGVAWRCLPGVKLLAASPSLPDLILAAVVASGRPAA